ncbi:MAG: citrate synthase/methylcitrate synthase [Candidatus Omnitrophica bacterium]|nr:citrate synthase/methylcitrate synthase [Candidatus Omnitrophota bacterium]
MHEQTKEITRIILDAAKLARQETDAEPEPELTKRAKWPIECIVGPGLEGAIACETEIGYVNGSKGWLVYRGYDIFDLCAYSNYEEVSYLLVHGAMPTDGQLKEYKKKIFQYFHMPKTLRLLTHFPIEEMTPMAALRFGTSLMRQEFTTVDKVGLQSYGSGSKLISSDEDSIAMETKPRGEERAIYEFMKNDAAPASPWNPSGIEACYHLIAGVCALTASIARMRRGLSPVAPDPELSHSGNLLYMMTGKKPTPLEERIMDVSLILHADHGMNASTFASMVVASTLSDLYLSIGSGIAALTGPLHGGANEKVIEMLREIGGAGKVDAWFADAVEKKQKIMGFGHRVYKAYDPRARVLDPLADFMSRNNAESRGMYETAKKLEKLVVAKLGSAKKIFPNVDFYSGIVYHSMSISAELFTTLFAVSRVAGWTARVQEYLLNNRIFRPRALYVGQFNKKYVPIDDRA